MRKEQLSQAQHSQGAGQGQVKQQGAGAGAAVQAEGTAGQAAQTVPIKPADCFADFNPPTVEQYQEARAALMQILARMSRANCVGAYVCAWQQTCVNA